MNNRYWNRAIPIAHQLAGLKKSWPQGKVEITDHNQTILWHGKIQPSPFGRVYEITLKYTIGNKPRVIVMKPDLKLLAGGESIPHIYPNDKKIKGTVLCLYLPKIKDNKITQWHPSRHSLAETIIPWTALWLYYYEHWLLTGNWEGGGEHPDID